MARSIVSRRPADSSLSRKPTPAEAQAARKALAGQPWRALDRNKVSLALCHARAILLLLADSNMDMELQNAASAAIEFIDDAKANVDGFDRRDPLAGSGEEAQPS